MYRHRDDLAPSRGVPSPPPPLPPPLPPRPVFVPPRPFRPDGRHPSESRTIRFHLSRSGASSTCRADFGRISIAATVSGALAPSRDAGRPADGTGIRAGRAGRGAAAGAASAGKSLLRAGSGEGGRGRRRHPERRGRGGGKGRGGGRRGGGDGAKEEGGVPADVVAALLDPTDAEEFYFDVLRKFEIVREYDVENYLCSKQVE